MFFNKKFLTWLLFHLCKNLLLRIFTRKLDIEQSSNQLGMIIKLKKKKRQNLTGSIILTTNKYLAILQPLVFDVLIDFKSHLCLNLEDFNTFYKNIS